MADLYAKALESERKKLWATCRLKGLPKMSAERERIAELDRLLAAHADRSSLSRSDGEGVTASAVTHPKDGGGVSSPPKQPKK